MKAVLSLSERTDRLLGRAGLAWPMALLTTGGFVLGLEIGKPEALQAFPLATNDTDGDGLADIVEQVRWTDPYVADSDGDGFSDLEELARHGDPTDATQLPRPAMGGTDAGIATYTSGAELHTLLTFYGVGTALFERRISVGVAVFGQLVELPPQVYLANARVSVLPAADPEAEVIVVDTVAPVGLLHALGSLSTYTTLADPGEPVNIADTANLYSVGGVVAVELAAPPSWFQPEAERSYIMQSQSSTGSGAGPSVTPGGGGLYRPLSGGSGTVPVTWNPGEVCVQKTTVVGGNGTMTRHLIQQASCEEADGSCASTCATLPGGYVETLDPITLIGG
jgi:hypothetical protein